MSLMLQFIRVIYIYIYIIYIYIYIIYIYIIYIIEEDNFVGCPFHGCQMQIAADNMGQHQAECYFNPARGQVPPPAYVEPPPQSPGPPAGYQAPPPGYAAPTPGYPPPPPGYVAPPPGQGYTPPQHQGENVIVVVQSRERYRGYRDRNAWRTYMIFRVVLSLVILIVVIAVPLGVYNTY